MNVGPGYRSGKLLVIRENGFKVYPSSSSRRKTYECLCDCGALTTVRRACLQSKSTRSCGCMVSAPKHGKFGSRVHRTWASMLGRCRNPNTQGFERYGGRGITVCDRWHSFENFYADMGDPPPGLSLDRIDNDGNYEPSNCRWATYRQQMMNRHNSRPVMVLGEAMTVGEICAMAGTKKSMAEQRIKRGWPIWEACVLRPHVKYTPCALQ